MTEVKMNTKEADLNTSVSVAVFAHNVAQTLTSCIECLANQEGVGELQIYVLDNGSSDGTSKLAEELAIRHANLHHVQLDIADKANAWNHYLHEIAIPSVAHVFVDGDVLVEPGALQSMLGHLKKDGQVNAVGAVPSVGRDSFGWIRRMVNHGRVSGGLYLLSDGFVQALQHDTVRLPLGLIGEDFLISGLAKQSPAFDDFYQPSSKLVIDQEACFTFRQLSPLHPKDTVSYIKRLLRYRIRDHQLSILVTHLSICGVQGMPQTVRQLYRLPNALPNYTWRGRATVLDMLAVYLIRRAAR